MTESKLQHYNFLEGFDIQDQCLVIGGRKITEIVSKDNDTPAYVYDHQIIDRKIHLLREYLPKGLLLHYAIKANPLELIVNYISSQVDGLDIASGNELTLALKSGTSASAISFASPGKSDHDLTMAIDSGIV